MQCIRRFPWETLSFSLWLERCMLTNSYAPDLGEKMYREKKERKMYKREGAMLSWSWAQEVASSHWKVVVKTRTAMVLVLTRDWKSLGRTLMSFSGMWMSLLFQKYPVITRIRLEFSFLLYAPTLSFRSSINIFHQSWFWHQIVRQRRQRSAELCVMSSHEQMSAVAPTDKNNDDDDSDAVVPPAEDDDGDHDDGCCFCWGWRRFILYLLAMSLTTYPSWMCSHMFTGTAREEQRKTCMIYPARN